MPCNSKASLGECPPISGTLKNLSNKFLNSWKPLRSNSYCHLPCVAINSDHTSQFLHQLEQLASCVHEQSAIDPVAMNKLQLCNLGVQNNVHIVLQS